MARILLGVTGGIAAYKTPELVRQLKKAGHDVRVVVSNGGAAFVSTLSLQAVSGHPVGQTLLDAESEAAMDHIALARWADTILVAPATANRIAALRMGFADDLLTTLCLAATGPLVLAPAMNKQMWEHPATQENMSVLKQRGVKVLGPAWGEQACGEVGWGRMIALEAIVQHFAAQPPVTRSLQGKRVIVTAGPTREPLDPVRYLSNRSSGKMGFAVAAAAAAAGATVHLISGPVSLPTPAGVQRTNVETANEMLAAVKKSHQTGCDIFIGVAAVADYYCEEIPKHKVKKVPGKSWQPIFTENPDILATVAQTLQPRPFCVGFAAETHEPIRYAREKLSRKSLDMIALNTVNETGTGFEADMNALQVFWPQGEVILEKALKQVIAQQLMTLIGTQYDEKHTVKDIR